MADNAYTEFSSVKYNSTLIAFNRSGRPRQVKRPVKAGTKAVQFIERALKIRLYRGRKYKTYIGRGSKRIDLYRKKQPYDKIFVSYKRWREFKRWLKLNKKTSTGKKLSLTATTVPRVKTTMQMISTFYTESIKVL